MAETIGLNHLGLTVRDLDLTTDFFTRALGWQEIAHDAAYPRSTVTDGQLRLTLWQASSDETRVPFNRKSNIGLHHLALEVPTKDDLFRLAKVVQDWPGTVVEFLPEPMGSGPRMHMIFAEPGGIRLELLWQGK
jgi:catechol 2,3-dioxygenase-like lactoylglutathione lyase family enzyme